MHTREFRFFHCFDMRQRGVANVHHRITDQWDHQYSLFQEMFYYLYQKYFKSESGRESRGTWREGGGDQPQTYFKSQSGDRSREAWGERGGGVNLKTVSNLNRLMGDVGLWGGEVNLKTVSSLNRLMSDVPQVLVS